MGTPADSVYNEYKKTTIVLSIRDAAIKVKKKPIEANLFIVEYLLNRVELQPEEAKQDLLKSD